MVSAAVTAGSSYSRLLAGICGAHPAPAAVVRAGIQAVAEGEVETFSLEFPCRMEKREMRLRLLATPCREGAPACVWVSHTDAAAAPDRQIYELEALGRLAGGVAHDFANLVTLIAGYSDILLHRMPAHDPSRPEIEEIRKAAARGAGVTAQILNFIRKQAALPGMVDLNALVAELMKLLRPILREDISLVVTLDPHLASVAADPVQMTRVLMNLVLNARDAMPKGGAIRIRTANMEPLPDPWPESQVRRQVMLEVSDNGSGMDPETLSRIFEPFFTTKDNGGTGLGLSTVRSIVEQAGGAVRARSEPGQGTAFTICLPRAGQEGEIADQHFLQCVSHTGTETILLVEDEPSVRKLLKQVLESHGYRVLEAGDGRQALGLLERHAHSIDLLLTDVVMPGLNGRELAQKALALQFGLKVIYMSGYADDVLLETGVLGRGMSFVRKPLQLDTLTAQIREVLDTPPVE